MEATITIYIENFLFLFLVLAPNLLIALINRNSLGWLSIPDVAKMHYFWTTHPYGTSYKNRFKKEKNRGFETS